MTRGSKKLLSQIENFLSVYFQGRKYFACVYGSYANGKRDQDSDIDILIATNTYTKKDLAEIKKFIVNFHKKNHLKIDNEVPFENKLMISYKDFEDAVSLKAFHLQKGYFVIPNIVKTKGFLASREVKFRLALNAITSPHFFFGNNRKIYLKLKDLGEKNVFLMANNLLKGNSAKKEDLVEVLLYGRNGEYGKLYLGYMKVPMVISYLALFIGKYLKVNKSSKESIF